MKRDGKNYDESDDALRAIGSLTFKSPRVVAFYLRFESVRDALNVMLTDRTHVEPRNVAGPPDEEYEAANQLAAQLDADATDERNRIILDVVEKLGRGSQAEIRLAGRAVEEELDRFAKEFGCRPVAFESITRHVVVDERAEGNRHTGRVADRGPNQNPVVHALIWLEAVVRPILIAHRAPRTFFSQVCRSFGTYHYDPRSASGTVKRWGRHALLNDEELRGEFMALPRRERQKLLASVTVYKRDGRKPEPLAVHIERAERVEHWRRDGGFSIEQACDIVAKEENLSREAVRDSFWIARRAPPEPAFDHLDFVI